MNLGILLGISPQHLILRCHDWEDTKQIPAIDEPVYDANKQHIGKIADIFGPVKKPFISISLDRRSSLKLEDFADKKGASFYTIPNVKKKTSSFKPHGRSRPEISSQSRPRYIRHDHDSQRPADSRKSPPTPRNK